LGDLDGGSECLYTAVIRNRGHWQIMANILEKRGFNRDMNIFQDDALEREVLDVVAMPS
jgi:hypothetical protein